MVRLLTTSQAQVDIQTKVSIVFSFSYVSSMLNYHDRHCVVILA